MASDPEAPTPRLWNWIKDVEPYNKVLAWCHTTHAYRFRSMVECGECRLQLCPVFAEDLLYFFYGRPAYRVTEEPMSKSSALPVVLLFDPQIVDSGKRLFPFDTGAFHANRLDNWMDPEMKLPHFEMECGSDAVLRFVAALYESNDKNQQASPRRSYVPQ